MEDSVRVLLVEDDELLSSFLNYKLVRNGFVVTACGDGDEGLAAIEQGQFDVVLLDLMLPRLNGFQLMQRAHEVSGGCPEVWIVISARSSDEDMLRAFELGAADFLTKPFSMDVLLARVNAALRFKRATVQPNGRRDEAVEATPDSVTPEEVQPAGAKLKRWHASRL